MAVYTYGPQVAFGSWAFSKPASQTTIFNIFMGLVIMNRQWCDPAPPGWVIPNSYIPNIRPKVDVNLFISIFNTWKKILPHLFL